MSPAGEMTCDALTSFPRASGDEPCVSATEAIPAALSPRERG